MLDDHSGNMCDSVPIAYELQARFGTGIEWITLAIRGTAASVSQPACAVVTLRAARPPRFVSSQSTPGGATRE
jgi:hypothetical protein